MKKLNRLYIIILVFVLVMQLTGCGENETSVAPQESTSTESPLTESTDLTSADLNTNEEEVDSPEPTSDVSWEATEPEEIYEPIVYFPLKPTIDETALYDQDQIRIVAKEITYNDRGAEVSLIIENHTEKDLSFSSNTIAYSCNSINGHMFAFGYVNEDVAAGNTVETSISISGDELFLYGITDIADMELGFRITDDDYNVILTGPCPIRTSVADTYDYSVVSFADGISDPRVQKEYGYTVISIGKTKIYDVLDLTVDSELAMKSKGGDTLIALEVTNNGKELKYLALENIVINGLTVEPSGWTSEAINPGKTGTLKFSVEPLIDESIKTLTGINELTNISFDLTQKDSNFDTIADPAQVTINLPGNGSYNNGKEIYRSDRIVVYQLGIVPDASDYSDNYHIALIYENLCEEELEIYFPNDGFIINGNSEASASTYTFKLHKGAKVLQDITVYGYSFDDIGISTWDEVTTVALKIETRLDYRKTLEETTLEIDPSLSKVE